LAIFPDAYPYTVLRLHAAILPCAPFVIFRDLCDKTHFNRQGRKRKCKLIGVGGQG